jgi:hypothetical protein
MAFWPKNVSDLEQANIDITRAMTACTIRLLRLILLPAGKFGAGQGATCLPMAHATWCVTM